MTDYFLKPTSTQMGMLTMAFDIAQGMSQPEKTKSELTSLQLGKEFASKLMELSDLLRQRKSNLRIENLRGRLQLADQRMLRLQLKEDQVGYLSVVTTTPYPEARRKLNLVIESWLNEQVADGISADEHEQRLLHDLKAYSQRGAFTGGSRPMQPFDWTATQRQTVKAGDFSFSDLADYVALALEGQVLWEAQQPMRLVTNAQGQGGGSASLLSEPLGGGDFSYVVNIQVLTFALYQEPMISINISKRNWLGPKDKPKNFIRNKTLSAYAFPKGSSRVLPFSLRKKKNQKGEWVFETDDSFAPIARAYGLPFPLTLPEILKSGTSFDDCHLLVNVKNGVTQKSSSRKLGAANDDKVEAMQAISDILRGYGLELNQSLIPIATETRDMTREQAHQLKWSLTAEKKLRERWQRDTFAHIDHLYGGQYELLLAYQNEHQEDARWLERHVQQLFGAEGGTPRLHIHTVKLPLGVHGPPEQGKATERRERQAARWKEWFTSLKDVQMPQFDGIIVLAQQWYDHQHDDKINKLITRHELATNFGKPVQFLRPRADMDGKTDDDFERHFMMGWMDLAYQSRGRVTPWTLETAALQIFDRRAPQPVLFGELQYPDEVMALGVIRKNKSNFAQTKGTIFPYAIRLSVRTGLCKARIAHVRPQTGIDYGSWMPMEEALTYISSLGEIRIHQAQRGQKKNDIRTKQSEHIQQFFNICLTEFGKECQRPLAFVDADTSKAYWGWLTDSRINPDNVNLVIPNAQGNWPNVRLIRVRTDNSPKILTLKRHSAEKVQVIENESELIGEQAYSDGSSGAETQLYRLGHTNTFVSFGKRKVQMPVIGSNLSRKLKFVDLKQKYLFSKTGQPRAIYKLEEVAPASQQWATPSGVELMVVRDAGDDPVNLASLAEWLRQNYAHFNEWTVQPAPLSFAKKLKEYVFDMDYADLDEDSEE